MATVMAFATCSSSMTVSFGSRLAAHTSNRSAAKSHRGGFALAKEEEPEDSSRGPSPRQPRLAGILKNKQRVLQAQLSSLQSGELEKRLSSMEPSTPPYRLMDAIAGQLMVGKTTIVAEIARLSPSESLESFSSRCEEYVTWGADALAVCTDEESSPIGAVDLATACKVVSVPVLRKDWIIHPLQVLETREAGANAVTAVYSVLTKGTPAILQYAVNLGLDAIVEVVNLQELQAVVPMGAPLYGFNLSVSISLSFPGLRQDIAKALIREIPFGATSIVGVGSIEEARAMKLEGADAVYVSHQVLQGRGANGNTLPPRTFLNGLRDALTGDD